jgi:hypothetical protein
MLEYLRLSTVHKVQPAYASLDHFQNRNVSFLYRRVERDVKVRRGEKKEDHYYDVEFLETPQWLHSWRPSPSIGEKDGDYWLESEDYQEGNSPVAKGSYYPRVRLECAPDSYDRPVIYFDTELQTLPPPTPAIGEQEAYRDWVKQHLPLCPGFMLVFRRVINLKAVTVKTELDGDRLFWLGMMLEEALTFDMAEAEDRFHKIVKAFPDCFPTTSTTPPPPLVENY